MPVPLDNNVPVTAAMPLAVQPLAGSAKWPLPLSVQRRGHQPSAQNRTAKPVRRPRHG
ncbi:hypothetical protein ACR9YC_12525 [Parasphingorhabdus sp. DH2-15]|uniref:hypothetical protein n=1 Tax=Parasphingorhabdus sp. DH2-15 TaxID=3444112 RepID=UPI003F6890A3